MKIAIIGPGRLGRSLNQLWRNIGHEVFLFGRHDALVPVEVIVVAVPDREIPQVVRRLPHGTPALHTSGACAVDTLRPHTPAGSWHPLMTFPGPELSIPPLAGVAVAVAGDPQALEIGARLAKGLHMRPIEVVGDRRLYHAAAVIAGNFATVLLLEAALVMEKAGVHRSVARQMLAPLALQSLKNTADIGPDSLTGPIARGDEQVLQGHRTALREFELQDSLKLYDEFSKRARRLLSSNADSGGKEHHRST